MMDDSLEREVLGCVLNGAEQKYYRNLFPNHFLNQQNRKIYELIKIRQSENKPINMFSILIDLRKNNKTQLIKHIQEIGERSGGMVNFDIWVEQLISTAQNWESKREYKLLVEQYDQLKPDEFNRRLEIIKELRLKHNTKCENLKNIWKDKKEFLIEESKNPLKEIACSFGYYKLDKHFKCKKKELTILAAATSMGKSAFALNLALFAAMDGKCVVVFSLEMDKTAILKRVLANMSGTDINRIANNTENGSLLKYETKLDDIDFYVNDQDRLTVSDIESIVESQLRKPDLIIVDYLNMVKNAGKHDRHDIAVGDKVRGLRSIAKRVDCHLIALAQVNRSYSNRDKKEPRLHDLRDSGQIEEAADNVLMLNRPSYFDDKIETTEHILRDEMWLYIRKQRNGWTGPIKYDWLPRLQRFEEVS